MCTLKEFKLSYFQMCLKYVFDRFSTFVFGRFKVKSRDLHMQCLGFAEVWCNGRLCRFSVLQCYLWQLAVLGLHSSRTKCVSKMSLRLHRGLQQRRYALALISISSINIVYTFSFFKNCQICLHVNAKLYTQNTFRPMCRCCVPAFNWETFITRSNNEKGATELLKIDVSSDQSFISYKTLQSEKCVNSTICCWKSVMWNLKIKKWA